MAWLIVRGGRDDSMVLVYVSLIRFMGHPECLYVEDQIFWGGIMGLSGAEIHCLHGF